MHTFDAVGPGPCNLTSDGNGTLACVCPRKEQPVIVMHASSGSVKAMSDTNVERVQLIAREPSHKWPILASYGRTNGASLTDSASARLLAYIDTTDTVTVVSESGTGHLLAGLASGSAMLLQRPSAGKSRVLAELLSADGVPITSICADALSSTSSNPRIAFVKSDGRVVVLALPSVLTATSAHAVGEADDDEVRNVYYSPVCESERALGVALSGDCIAVALEDGRVIFHSISGHGGRTWDVQVHARLLSGMVLRPDGKAIATCAEDSTIAVLSLPTRSSTEPPSVIFSDSWEDAPLAGIAYVDSTSHALGVAAYDRCEIKILSDTSL